MTWDMEITYVNQICKRGGSKGRQAVSLTSKADRQTGIIGHAGRHTWISNYRWCINWDHWAQTGRQASKHTGWVNWAEAVSMDTHPSIYNYNWEYIYRVDDRPGSDAIVEKLQTLANPQQPVFLTGDSVDSQHAASSGVYICKSIVNDLRHENYICNSEVIYLSAFSTQLA